MRKMKKRNTNKINKIKKPYKFYTHDVSLPRSVYCFRLVEANFPRGTTNQKHNQHLGSDT